MGKLLKVERDKPKFTKKLGAASAAIFLATWIGVTQISKKSDCKEEIKWERNGSVAVCSDYEGRVTVQKADRPSWQLPEGVCHVGQVFSFKSDNENVLWYRYVDDYLMEMNNLNLDTGEIGIPFYYGLPAYPNSSCKK